MSAKKWVLVISILVIIAGLLNAGYQVLRAPAYNEQGAYNEEVAATKQKLVKAIGALGTVSANDIGNGFWYVGTDASGNDIIGFFDADAIARTLISDEGIADIAAKVQRAKIAKKTALTDVPTSQMPTQLQFHNALYSFGTTTTLQYERTLRAKVAAKTETADDVFKLSYLAELSGEYRERDHWRDVSCRQFKQCPQSAAVRLSGIVTDADGAVANATVEVLGESGVTPAKTDAKGNYSLTVTVPSMTKLRVRAGKRNYSDGYANVVLLSGAKSVDVPAIMLETPIHIVTIDYQKKTVTGKGNTLDSQLNAKLTTSNSVYEIPRGAIVDAAGKPYTKGPIEVYLYEFTKGNPPESLLQLDTFDQVRGYAGNLMKSFGMPYIQFFAEDGTELDVLKSTPMKLTYRIANMEDLYRNTDRIYRALTNDDMSILAAASRENPMSIDRAFLIEHHLLAFPAFWVFDRTRGIWDNVPISVLDTTGLIQTIFYTQRDDL